MTSPDDADHRGSVAAGCAVAMVSALVTCFMLFINGSFVWALLSALANSGPSWASKPELSQFLLFLLPVLMVIAEWIMIDYVRSRMRHRDRDD